MDVTFLAATSAGAVIFGFGILLGMLVYRVLWHIDTAALRAELEGLKVHNRALQDEIVRLQNSHTFLGETIETMRGELRDYKNRAMLQAGIKGGA